MAFDENVAQRVRNALRNKTNLPIIEKKMFGGLAFLVDDKMCVNVSKDRLMCRFHPEQQDEIAAKTGFQKMKMKGRSFKGFCYVEPIGFSKDEDLHFWLDLCLKYIAEAKRSKKRKS